jgi:hypothetical protein
MKDILQINDPNDHQAREAHAVAVYEQMRPDEIAHTWRQYSAIDETYDVALGALPARNPEFGEAVYRTIAESPDPEDRFTLVTWLPDLCRASPIVGAELWGHLIRDPEAKVREDALNHLEEILGVSPGPGAKDSQGEGRQSLGLDWQDITNLYRAYVRAEREPHTRYKPGTQSTQVDPYSMLT